MVWDVGPAKRRELFYTELLSTVDAAKEVRLFGIGGFLRQRLLAERRTVNAAMRRVDRRQLWTQGGLALSSALVSGAALLWAVDAARQGRLSVGDVTVFIVWGSRIGITLIYPRFHGVAPLHKSKRWITARSFGAFNPSRRDQWFFGDRDTGAYLLKFVWTKITRHTLVKGRASPDDPAMTDYWAARRRRGKPTRQNRPAPA